MFSGAESIGYQEEQFFEIIFNLDQRRCRLKIFLIWNSGGPFVQWSGILCAILVEGIMKNNSMIYFKFGLVVRGCLIYFLSGVLAALVFSGAEPFMQF